MQQEISPTLFLSENDRWEALLRRDPDAEGSFYYAVTTTGVYCRPTCPARLALRRNIAFYRTPGEAERSGFRPCKRCAPNQVGIQERQREAITRVCRFLEENAENPGLEELARLAGMSSYHFHRVFKAHTGLTPKRYAVAQQSRRVRAALSDSPRVTDAIYEAGFGSSSRFYERSNQLLGMTPASFRKGGDGAEIRFAIADCWLGAILVAASEKGICSIALGDDPEQLANDLQDRFPNAELIGADSDFEDLVAKVIGFLESPAKGLGLPLDIRGTAFQQRVWQALRDIPPGETISYSALAERIGRPKSLRAVARACATNPIAVAIPCHRIIRLDGSISGYRWGVQRKNQLLSREREGT